MNEVDWSVMCECMNCNSIHVKGDVARNDRTVIDGFLARVRERYDYLQSNLRCDSNSVFNFSDLHKHATNDVYAEMFPKEQSPSG